MSDPKHPVVGDMAIDATDVTPAALTTDQILRKIKVRAGFSEAVASLTRVSPAQIQAGEISADDLLFRVGSGGNPTQYVNAPAPASLVVRPGAGTNGSDRVEVTWADGAIVDQWLQVTVLPNVDTGLSSPDVFYFGNLPGEVGDNPNQLFVNSLDVQRTRINQFQQADITSPYDHNRSGGIVNAQDVQLARINQFSTIALLAAPPLAAALGAEDKEEEQENG